MKIFSLCLQATLENSDQQRILEEVCHILTGLTEVQTVLTTTFNSNKKILQTCAVAGKGKDDLAPLKISLNDQSSQLFHPLLDLTTDEHHRTTHLYRQDDHPTSLQAKLKTWMWHSVCCWQLTAGTKTFGVLAIFTSNADGLNSSESQLVENIVDTINLKFTHLAESSDIAKYSTTREDHPHEQGTSSRNTTNRSTDSALLSALDRVNDGIVSLDKNWHYTYLNEPAAKMLQREKPQDLLGTHIWTEFPEGVGQPFHLAYIKAFEAQQPGVIEQHYEPWDLWFENRIYPSPDGITIYFTEITKRKKAEEELRISQKMEAIGNLASGIAHDFNNMLGVILGFSEISQLRLKDENPDLLKNNEYVIQAAKRAKKLTSNLLDFSRNVPSVTEVVSVNSVLNKMHLMLERTLTPLIKLVYNFDDNVWPILVDMTRFEDSVLNMCINSMHAMPDGGTLTLNTTNHHLSELDVQHKNIDAGDYVLLTVNDTGTGVTRDVQQKIFDPFFTTKGAKGTGLGLSQVYGFVQQSGGYLQVYSEPGHGLRIALYFPRHLLGKVDVAKRESVKDTPEPPKGNETILVVDDEIPLLDLSYTILTQYGGYKVYCTDSGQRALEIMEETPVDLLLSDIIMPNMSGYQLATQARKNHPAVKIKLMSGFNDRRTSERLDATLHLQQLSKPFTSHELLTAVRNILDA